MDDPIMDNQTMADGTSDENDAGTIESIMGGMSDNSTPEAKPDDAAEGTNAEGNENQTEKDDAGEYPAWTKQLPEDLRNDSDFMKQIAKFQKIGDVAKSYSELEKKLGNSIVIPGKDASEEEKNAFYEKIGKPKSADGYSINDENAKAFKELAYKMDLTDSQAKGLYESFKSMGEQMLKQQQVNVQQQAAETTEALRKEYGSNFNSAIKYLQKGVMAYGGKELGDKLKATGLLADKTVVDMFIKLGKQVSEAGTTTKSAGGQNYKSSMEGGTFGYKYD